MFKIATAATTKKQFTVLKPTKHWRVCLIMKLIVFENIIRSCNLEKCDQLSYYQLISILTHFSFRSTALSLFFDSGEPTIYYRVKVILLKR